MEGAMEDLQDMFIVHSIEEIQVNLHSCGLFIWKVERGRDWSSVYWLTLQMTTTEWGQVKLEGKYVHPGPHVDAGAQALSASSGPFSGILSWS